MKMAGSIELLEEAVKEAAENIPKLSIEGLLLLNEWERHEK